MCQMNFMSSAVETSYDTESMEKISPLRCYAPSVEMTRRSPVEMTGMMGGDAGRECWEGMLGRDDGQG